MVSVMLLVTTLARGTCEAVRHCCGAKISWQMSEWLVRDVFVQGWACTQIFEGHSHYVMQCIFNPKDTNTFASASLDRTVKVATHVFPALFWWCTPERGRADSGHRQPSSSRMPCA